MVMELTFRRVQRQDMADVIDMLQAISEFSPPADTHDRVWETFNAQPHIIAEVGLLDGKVVAFGCAVLETKIRGGTMAHIEDIVVSTAHRNGGLGQQLLKHLETECRRKSVYKLSLACRPNRVAFYNRCGYEEAGHAMSLFPKK